MVDRLPEFELQDELYSNPEDIVITISIAGNPVTVNRTDGKPIQLALVKNPIFGVRGNSFADVVYVTTDGQAPLSKGKTMAIGESLYLPGLITTGKFKFDTNNNGTNVEITLWG